MSRRYHIVRSFPSLHAETPLACPTMLRVSVFLLLCSILSCHTVAKPIEHPAKGLRHTKAQQFQSHGGYGDADKYRVPDEEQADRPDEEPENREPYYKSSEDHYAPKECQDDCPNPQVADDIFDAYIGHLTFNWAELAARTAAGGKKRQDDTKARSGNSTRSPLIKEPSAPRPRRPERKHFGARAADKARASPPASTAPGHKHARGPSAAHTAAVTNPEYLLPTGNVESGSGFQGTFDPNYIPSNEAIAVGPHPDDEGSVLVLHGVDSAFEVFEATRDGRRLRSAKVYFDDIVAAAGFDAVVLTGVQAFYDQSAHRYVIAWTSYYKPFTVRVDDYYAPLFVCASASNNPTEDWTCWALDSFSFSNVFFCPNAQPSTGRADNFLAGNPKLSYSSDGIFISVGQYCYDDYAMSPFRNFYDYLAAVYVFPKKVLYTPPADGTKPTVYRATYFPSASWFRSLPLKDQVREYDPSYPYSNSETFDIWAMPSRPQGEEDVVERLLVMGKERGGGYLSIARLTNEPLDKMTSLSTAPRIIAAVVDRGLDFANANEPAAVMPQPGPEGQPGLIAGALGALGRTYGATHHHGDVLVATSEWFGEGDARLPSIYWAVVDPSPNLCKLTVERRGVVASEDGLALAYPSIAAHAQGGVILAYSYAGNTTVTLDGVSYPAYAGAATSIVGVTDQSSSIDIVKRGDVSVGTPDLGTVVPWGRYSAVDFIDNTAWFAVPVALDGPDTQYQSWVFPHDLGRQRNYFEK